VRWIRIHAIAPIDILLGLDMALPEIMDLQPREELPGALHESARPSRWYPSRWWYLYRIELAIPERYRIPDRLIFWFLAREYLYLVVFESIPDSGTHLFFLRQSYYPIAYCVLWQLIFIPEVSILAGGEIFKVSIHYRNTIENKILLLPTKPKNNKWVDYRNDPVFLTNRYASMIRNSQKNVAVMHMPSKPAHPTFWEKSYILNL